ncbi:MAG: Na+/H+ antiporter NhaA [Betaproteobacteria bacterium]|nr:Na+/H+ antiporter NhaA [Betaproteobacteria bacterium]
MRPARLSPESRAGLALLGATLVALTLANSPFHADYEVFFETQLAFKFGELGLAKPLFLWINDGLMAVFFLAIGIEIKHELLSGNLATPRQAALPAIAAAGGVLVPALVYGLVARDDPVALQGWAIPAATDIAFALAAFSAFSRRVPPALKVFLTAVAVLDDLAAIVIIAVFYTSRLQAPMLIVAGAGIIVLIALNRRGVMRTAAYVLVGVVVWVAVLKSGVHATLAGIAVGFALPHARRDGTPGPGAAAAQALAPWVAFAIMPLFALANAGVSFAGFGMAAALNPITLGIAAGLLVGKPVGVLGATWLAQRAGLVVLPPAVTWKVYAGVAALCGIGFTMSLFIGTLAFVGTEHDHMPAVRQGVLMGSVLSALLGSAILGLATRPDRP